MDNVFQEEQKKLAEVEAKLDAIANKHEQHGKDLQAEILDFYCVDNEDRMRKRELIQEQSSAYKTAEKYRGYMPSPYFGRLDLDNIDNEEIETFYIGKEGISENSKIMVVDWRTPMGSCYYASNQKEFSVNGRNFLLSLKRALDIQNGELITYRTEYDGETVSLEGDVIDPFLLTVLKDKRRHNRLTDIIRTIQGNQNEIIRKDRMESFVVQGCAGSGKTMILLHRLSFLKFNNRNMSLSGVKIITPNRFFDAHINDLSKELGLTSIERFSVEEYYVYLMKRFFSKITVDPAVQSEKILSSDLLEKLYSVNYLEQSIENYHNYWNQIVSEIDEERLKDLFKKLNIVYPDTSKHTVETFSLFEQGQKRLSAKIAEIEEKYKQILSRLKTIDKDIASEQSEFEKAEKSMLTVKNQTVSRIELELAATEEAYKKFDEEKLSIDEQKKSVQNQRSTANTELERNIALVRAATSELNKYSNYDNFIRQNDSISVLIKNEHKSIISDIVDAENQYRKTPAYNFSKRNALRRKITDGKTHFTAVVSEFLSNVAKTSKITQEELRASIQEFDAEIKLLDESYRAIDKQYKQGKVRLIAIKECFEVFSTQEYPDTQKRLSSATRKECGNIISQYEKQYSTFMRFQQRVKSIVETKEKLESDKITTEAELYPKTDIEFVENCGKTIKKLQFSEISRGVMFKDLLAAYKEHTQKYSKTNYRHKIYLKLLFCSLYYSKFLNPDNFLNIDEAQDISIAEYKLLRMILGEKCVFNLYGDINQSVYSYKGITDWDDICDVTRGNIYILNENYRNTLQITEFCNEEFSSEVYPIGVSGDEVLELGIDEAVKWIVELKKQNPEYRVAIIHRHGVLDIQSRLSSLLAGENVSWYLVDEHKLSVLSVETAKGLEFEAIVSIVDQMSNNEKYISYTRALDKLCVVREKFNAGLMVDAGAEDFGDDFVEDDETDTTNTEVTENTPVDNINDVSDEHKEIDDSSDLNEEVNTFLSDDDGMLVAELQSILQESFGDNCKLSKPQQSVLCSLYHGENVAFSAPSGSMKSIILYLLALKEHQTSGKQSIITAEAHLQENELVLADQLGLRGGVISSSMTDFLSDFKKEQYDVIFVPYEFFEDENSVKEFTDYFSGKIAYWGVDHPTLAKSSWKKIRTCNESLSSTMYLMTKEDFDDLQLDDFSIQKINSEMEISLIKKLNFVSGDERHKWLLDNLKELSGQGLIYCDDEDTCKKIAKTLRKNKILAEAYVEVSNSSKKERVNYLTNSFSNGGLPILVTTQEVGKNLSNAKIRFILHYDVPADKQIYELHITQIGQLAIDPVVIDLNVI